MEANGQGSFWLKAEKADIFILLDTVQFSPHSYTCRALLPDGHTVYGTKHPYLTVPCKKPHMQAIRNIAIEWKYYKLGKHIRNLEAITLIRSRMQPFIDALRYGKECRGFEDRHWNSTARNQQARNPYDLLADWNELLIKRLAQSFEVKCQWRRASQMAYVGELDNSSIEFQLDHLLCWANATTYLTGPSWRNYAPNLKEVLNDHGIELEEVKTEK